MADNGFGTQDNSSDFLLRLYQIKPDFRTKSSGTAKVQVMSFVQLRDPNKLIPFNIVNQNTADRLLTGADFDPESIQRTADGTYWMGMSLDLIYCILIKMESCWMRQFHYQIH